MAVVWLQPCPRPSHDPWVPLSTRSKLPTAWGNSVKDVVFDSGGTPPGVNMVCDAHQDLLNSDGLRDFRSLFKLLCTPF